MKILTLNTHSLEEENYEQKLEWFVEGILREKPDLIAMQEVNQGMVSEELDPQLLEGRFPVPGSVRIRRDNHAAQVALRLRQRGIDCSWAWVPIKVGYHKYDEGIAILSLDRKIRCVDAFPISRSNDYFNWRTRAVLGVQLEGMDDWFYTVHTGWWNDEPESFLNQWKKLNSCIASKRMYGPVWLMGDFNAPDVIPGQSYDAIRAYGWLDTYHIAADRDDGITVPRATDGWRRLPAGKRNNGVRMDYIWCSRKIQVRSSRVMFNGRREPAVSDHYGVLIEAVV